MIWSAVRLSKQSTQTVSVERYVEQVRNGSHYKGYLKIGESKLDYELVFEFPIKQLDSMEPATSWDEVQRLFKITVKREDANIELTKEEYRFFFEMIVEFAVEFYNNPQTRDSQEGVLGALLRGNGQTLLGLDVSASIGMTSNYSYDFQPELCEMLSSPKFGCKLAA